jgi:hypothetical protein
VLLRINCTYNTQHIAVIILCISTGHNLIFREAVRQSMMNVDNGYVFIIAHISPERSVDNLVQSIITDVRESAAVIMRNTIIVC